MTLSELLWDAVDAPAVDILLLALHFLGYLSQLCPLLLFMTPGLFLRRKDYPLVLRLCCRHVQVLISAPGAGVRSDQTMGCACEEGRGCLKLLGDVHGSP